MLFTSISVVCRLSQAYVPSANIQSKNHETGHGGTPTADCRPFRQLRLLFLGPWCLARSGVNSVPAAPPDTCSVDPMAESRPGCSSPSPAAPGGVIPHFVGRRGEDVALAAALSTCGPAWGQEAVWSTAYPYIRLQPVLWFSLTTPGGARGSVRSAHLALRVRRPSRHGICTTIVYNTEL